MSALPPLPPPTAEQRENSARLHAALRAAEAATADGAAAVIAAYFRALPADVGECLHNRLFTKLSCELMAQLVEISHETLRQMEKDVTNDQP